MKKTKITCALCGWIIYSGTLLEHYRDMHPAAYAEYIRQNGVKNIHLKNITRKEF